MTTEVTAAQPVNGPLDPLGDGEALAQDAAKKNFAKVGSGRPSTLLYTYGPGAVMDLPQFAVMPAGLDDWDRIWARRDGETPRVHAPRLLDLARVMLGRQVDELRPYPWQPQASSRSAEGRDLGVPARVFPQWLRCTGCDLLAPLTRFGYHNTHPYRPDEAGFDHVDCPGRRGDDGNRKRRARPAVPARYLLACADGHLDEFPYDGWVHRGQRCATSEVPALQMSDSATGRSTATIRCGSCGLRRSMNEALGEAGRAKLPRCRGRWPHLDMYDEGCGNESRLMLIGASNLWFASTQSAIVMPHATAAEERDDLADQLRVRIGTDKLTEYADQLAVIRYQAREARIDVSERSDVDLEALVQQALAGGPDAQQLLERRASWSPIELLLPEWHYLQRDPLGREHDDLSGLMLSPRGRDGLPPEVSRVLAADKLRKVNALLGFTRIDDMDRVNDLPGRLAPLTRDRRPRWTVATEDRGEGIFLQLEEDRVAAWEAGVSDSAIWRKHQAAQRRNYDNRFSETAERLPDPSVRLPPPRYWLVHTFAHLLIREMAMQCGYSAASLTERLYAWPGTDAHPPAAGLLICTTASDSDGTLGGLVQLSDPARLAPLVTSALYRARRCSSDPICATRTPEDPEDFLHGAACHCCCMASETSCERSNRFLDRRFVLDLPGSDLGFLG